MKIGNSGNVELSKADCKSVRLIMGFNPDLRVKLGEKVINYSYLQASIVVKVMAENHLWHYCNGEEFTTIIDDNLKLYYLAERCLRGEYDYE